MALLEVTDLRTHFRTDDGIVKAVDGVSFSVEKGKTLGIVGESGSGKSVTCLTIMGLNDRKKTITSGEALFNGENLLTTGARRLRDIRGNDMALIFPDPMTSLNPVHSIGAQLVEAVQLHRDVSKNVAKARALELLKAVGIPRAERRIDDYPHQFSGGMRQRVMIAMALVNDAARVAEQAEVHKLFNRPHHPYTWGLLGSLPRLDTDVERLVQIPGQPPSLLRPPSGCRFHPRCPYVMEKCKTVEPPLVPISDDPQHLQACHLDEETKDREATKLLEATMAQVS